MPTSEQLEAMGWSEPQYRQRRMSNPGVGNLYEFTFYSSNSPISLV